jgi:hypothetical protein
MQVRITRLSPDDPSYAIDFGNGTRFVTVAELKRRLLDLGVGNSTIAAVLDFGPSQTMTIEVAGKAA